MNSYQRLLLSISILLVPVGALSKPVKAYCGSKGLFSYWRDPSLAYSVDLDLRRKSFGSNQYVFKVAEDQSCSVEMTIDGNDCVGVISVRVTSSDSGCEDLVGSERYFKRKEGLSICSSGNCRLYK